MPIRGDDRHLWERQPGETNRNYAIFEHYLEQGPYSNRSIAETARHFDLSRSYLGVMAKRWSWVARAGAWDDHVSKQKRQDDLLDAIEMRKAQRDAGRKMRRLGMQQLEVLMRKVERGHELTPNETRLLIDAGFKHEAAALGQADAPQQVQHKFENLDVSELSEEQLRRIVVDGEDPAKVLADKLDSMGTMH